MKIRNKNKQSYNYSKDSEVLIYEQNNDNSLKTLYYMLSDFLDIDNVAAFLIDDDYHIIKYNDIYHTTLDDDFFVFYDKEIRTTNDVYTIIKTYAEKKNYSFVHPLKNDSDTYGYIIFTKNKNDWTQVEKEHLQSCAHIYSQYLLNIDNHKELHYRQTIFHKMINNIDSHIYVTNPKTHEILFMNESMKRDYQIDNPVGKICWQVLQKNKTSACDECPVSFLMSHPDKSCIWEEVSTFNQKTYRNFDHMIDWFDHSIVHFQHSVDITDLKQVTYDATFDELTGIYNRRTGKSKLQELIAMGRNENKDIIVSLYDLDNLKLTNDIYGHVEGDHMLKSISDEIRVHTKENDVFFRLSGDEFVVGFYDYSKTQVNDIMQKVLQNLRKKAIDKNLKYELSFCYGLYKVQPENILTINEVIMNADERMYEWKKKSHLNKNQKALLDTPLYEETFEYDESLLYDALVKSTDDYIFICNMKTGVFKYTPSMVEEFNFPSAVLHNAAAVFGAKIHKDDKYEFLNSNQQITDGKSDSHIVEYRALNKNNEWVWLRCRGHVEYDDEGEPAIFAGFISNLGKKNYRDILTSLYNKFEFEKRISEMQGEFTIMLLNIDDFKSINSLYNREFGDNILRIIGQNLQTLFSKDATVFKLDGDEFGLIFKKLDDIQIKAIFQKILFYANQPHSYEDKPYTFTVTAGSASSPIDGTTYLKLQRNCEIALQYGKHNRRGKLTIFNEEIFTEKTFHLQLLNILKQDMKNDFRNFSLVYQPIIDANHRQIMKVEALCRWKHQNFSNIGPGYFIPLLEDTGDIVKLGKWIFKKAIEQIRDWLIFNPDISVSINVSYIQLIEEDFVSFVKKVIEEYDIPFDHVVIELTETAIAKNATLIIETIRSLRELGIQIAMDDFGTGYSSLSLLKDEPLDIIKIDQSFVRGIENDSFNQAFIKLIIELCHQIGLSVLIEGIETKKELDLILPLNPDFIQGYYTGMPMPTHELVHLIKKEKTS